ncbi:MAG: Calvin cycle protein CP12 [Cyanobacteria bacterium J06638_20]
MIQGTTATKTYTATTTQTEARVVSQPSLEARLQVALEHARRLTAMYGTGNIEVAIAWETVEELQKATVQQKASQLSPFAQYCAANPDAPECRIYED